MPQLRIDYPRIDERALLKMAWLRTQINEYQVLADLGIIMDSQIDEHNILVSELRSLIWSKMGQLGYNPGEYQIDPITGRISRKASFGIGGRTRKV